MPIELPHSGMRAGLGHVLLDELERELAGLLEGDGGRLDRLEQPAGGVHRAHDLVHLGERLGRLVDHEVRTFGHDLELVVGDDRGDLHDHVAGGSSPVISRSIHTSTAAGYPRGVTASGPAAVS